MPQPRKYKTNAERQAAYRKRKAATAPPPVERFQRYEDGSVSDHKGRVWDPDTREWRAPIRVSTNPKRPETRA